jgi:hypothetical protein
MVGSNGEEPSPESRTKDDWEEDIFVRGEGFLIVRAAGAGSIPEKEEYLAEADVVRFVVTGKLDEFPRAKEVPRDDEEEGIESSEVRIDGTDS